MAKRDWTIKRDKKAKRKDRPNRRQEKGLSGMVSEGVGAGVYGGGSFGPSRRNTSPPQNNNLLG